MANVRTPVGILSFPTLFTPRPRAQGGDAVYSCNLLLDQTAQKDPAWIALRKMVAQTIDEKWGAGKSRDQDFVRRLRMPWRPSQEKQYKGYDIPGGVYIAPWSNNRPGIVDARLQELMAPSDVWPGQLARLTVNPFAYANSGNMGVSLGLNNVQICRTDGERLDSRRAAVDDFDQYDDGTLVGADADDDANPF